MAELQKTDLNVSPYYDDFNENKNFTRILYRPATAVQARELTQMQTILQNQIAEQGNYTFKEGALVKGNFTLFYGANNTQRSGTMLNFVRVDDTFEKLGNTSTISVNNNMQIFFSSNHSVNSALLTLDGNAITSFNANGTESGAYIVGATTGVIQKVWYYTNGLESQYPNTNVLYTVDYATGYNDGNNVTYSTFNKDEVLYAFTDVANAETFRAAVAAGNTAADVANNSFAAIKSYNNAANSSQGAVGGSVGITTTDGVIYARGSYIRVDPQRAVIQQFDDTGQALTTKYVGFDVRESLITPELDSSLYDNATGTTNENAPGAHRLKLEGVLSVYETEPANTFSVLTTVGNTGIVEEVQLLPELNESGLGKQFADALKDSAGDYVIGSPTLRFKSISGNNTYANVQVNPAPGGSTLFVNGLRSTLIGPQYLPIRRGTDEVEEENVLTTINYGRYLQVDEVAGRIKFENYPKVYLVNTAVQAITDGTYGVTDASSFSSSIIGNTVLYAAVHEEGVQGVPETTYRFYVGEIKLANNNSIADVAGLLICDGADTDANNAVGFADLANTEIFASERSSLVFDAGREAIKEFQIAAGTDTAYVARARQNVGIAANGQISVTISSVAGSTDNVNYTGADIGDTLSDTFIITPVSNLISTNSTTYTVAVDSGDANVIFSGGTPSSYLQPGDLLSFANAANQDIRRVVQIDGTTVVTNAAASFTHAAANVARFALQGQPITLKGSAATVEGNTSTSTYTINTTLGTIGVDTVTLTAVGSQTVDVLYDVNRTEITNSTDKEINKNNYVIISTANNVGGTTGPWDLGLSDVHRIRSVYVGDSVPALAANLASEMTSVTTKFDVDSGQRDGKYDHGRLKIKLGSGYTVTNDYIVVELDHFTANTDNGSGYFTIDSYPISNNDPVSANSTTILTSEVPVFRSPITGRRLDLRSAIDFRPRVLNTANASTTLAGATYDPEASDVIIPHGGASAASLISSPNKNFAADLTYYLGRQDLITYNGRFFGTTEGIPSQRTKAPLPVLPTNEMPVAYVKVPPYPSLTDTETITPAIPYTDRAEYKFKHRIVTNRRFTMRDIGALAERISRLEYYTSLTLLEKAATDLQISDDTGLNRFKNGIFVDPFTSHIFGDSTTVNGIYKCSIDEQAYHLRPSFNQTDVELEYDNGASTNVAKYGSFVMLPLDTTEGANGHVTIKNQVKSSNSRNLADPIFEHHGTVVLCPNYDTRAELETENPFQVNIDLDIAGAMAPLTELPVFGEWRNLDVSTSAQVTGTNRINNTTVQDTILNTQTTTNARDVFNIGMDVFNLSYGVNNIIQDIRFNQYVRRQQIGVLMVGLLPNSRVHCFFDEENVDDLVRPGQLNPDLYPSIAANPALSVPTEGLDTENRESIIPANDSDIGDPIFADSNGTAYCVFYIPEDTYLQGERTFQVRETSDLLSVTRFSGKAKFISYSLSYFATDLTLTTTMPEYNVTTDEETNVIVENWTTSNNRWSPAPPPPNQGDGGDGGGDSGCVPLAQTFRINERNCARPTDAGVFVTELDLYFRTKHPTLGCDISLHETTTGNQVPDYTRRLPYSLVMKNSEDVTITGNEDGAVNPTTFVFKNPIFLARDKTYSIVLRPIAHNDGYACWFGRIGAEDQSGNQIGVLELGYGNAFYSKNARSWTAIQDEVLTFSMRRAAFDVASAGTVKLNNADDEYMTIGTASYANTSNKAKPGDFVVSQSNTLARGMVEYINEPTANLIITSSNGGFEANTTVDLIRFHKMVDDSANVTSDIHVANISQSNTTTLGNVSITTINDVGAHAVVLQVQPMKPTGTELSFTYRGMGNNYAASTSSITMPINDEVEFSLLEGGATSRIIASKSNESGTKSAVITGTLSSPTSGLSPVLDLSRRNLVVVTNKINNNSYLESTNDGGADCRYISSQIELADGQDAEDLEVYITAYRPPLTDIKVYTKVLSAADPALFEDKAWSELVRVTDDSVTSTSEFDTKEYRYRVKTGSVPTDTYANGDTFSVTTGAYISPVSASDTLEDEIITYQDNEGVYYQRFKYFAIKIVLTSSAPEIVPHVKDLRAIALQK